MSFLQTIQRAIRKRGIVIRKYPDGDLKRRMQIIRHFQFDLILDVGANTGQYASLMRDIGFTGKIISFEPLASAFSELQQRAKNDPQWEVRHLALGNNTGSSIIHIAGNSQSSSLLEMLPQHKEAAPESAYVGQEQIEIKKLDDIFSSLVRENEKVFLKIDTQGFEKQVLEGAHQSLEHIDGIQVEMSLVPLYKAAPTFLQMIEYLDLNGFALFSLESGFSDPHTGQLLQTDGIFILR